MQLNRVENVRKAMVGGDFGRARALVAEMLEKDPEDKIAWLFLSLLVHEKRKKIYCLERVQSLDPQHKAGGIARAWLSKLDLESYQEDADNRFSQVNQPHEYTSPKMIRAQPRDILEVDLEPFYEDLMSESDGNVYQDGPQGWTWRCNIQGEYQYCSPEVVDVLGSSPEKFLGQSLHSFYMEPSSREAVEEALREKVNPAQVSTEFRSLDGSIIPVQLHILPVVDQKGDFNGWQGFAEVMHVLDRRGSSEGHKSEHIYRYTPRLACPLLGLMEDPFTHTMYPNADHRCYRPNIPLPIEFSYQMKYCLREKFDDCSIYLNGLDNDIPDIIGKPKVNQRYRTIDKKLVIVALMILGVMLVTIISLIIYI